MSELHGELEHARRRARMASMQRKRMLAALCELCVERGVAELTVGAIVGRAGVSRRTFYEQFVGVEQCLLAALAQSIERACERARSAYDPARPWRVRLRAALAALLALGDEQPLLARMLLVELLAAGPSALALRERALEGAVAAVAQGAGETSRQGARLPALTAQGAVGGVLAILRTRVLTTPREPLLELLGELMALLVLPYLGGAAALAERSEPVPTTVAAADRVAAGDPLRELELRLTYRTMRVLAAVASSSGASNRMVGQAAGVKDQGQISKLLRRLAAAGLVENDAAGLPPGASNAWRITERGARLSEAFAGNADGRG